MPNRFDKIDTSFSLKPRGGQPSPSPAATYAGGGGAASPSVAPSPAAQTYGPASTSMPQGAAPQVMSFQEWGQKMFSGVQPGQMKIPIQQLYGMYQDYVQQAQRGVMTPYQQASLGIAGQRLGLARERMENPPPSPMNPLKQMEHEYLTSLPPEQYKETMEARTGVTGAKLRGQELEQSQSRLDLQEDINALRREQFEAKQKTGGLTPRDQVSFALKMLDKYDEMLLFNDTLTPQQQAEYDRYNKIVDSVLGSAADAIGPKRVDQPIGQPGATGKIKVRIDGEEGEATTEELRQMDELGIKYERVE